MGWVAKPLYFGFILTQTDPPLHKFVRAPAYFQENVALYEFLTNLDGLSDIGNSQIFKPAVDGGEIVGFSFELLFGDSLVNVG